MNRVKAVPEEMVESMICYLNRMHIRFGFMFEIGLCSGLRVSDILSLRVKDFKRGYRIKVREQKTGKARVVRLSKGLVKRIRQYAEDCNMSENDYIVFSDVLTPNRPLSRSQAYKVMARVSKAFNLTQISPHSLRKSYARALLKETGDLEEVRQALNHANMATTLLYIYDELDSLVKDGRTNG